MAVVASTAPAPPARESIRRADRILGVLMLAVGKGGTVTLRCTGREGAEAYAALSELISSGFGEP